MIFQNTDPKNQDHRIRLSWYAIMMAAGLFVVFGSGKLYEPGPPYDDPLGGSDAAFEYAQTAIIPLGLCLFLGFLGFYEFYSKRLTRTGKVGWLFLWLGSLAIIVGGVFYIPSRISTFWQILIMGKFIVSFGTLLIGFAGYRSHLFPKWRGAPLIIGITYTTILVIGSLNPTYQASLIIGGIIFLVTGIAWALFGVALRDGAVLDG
jgi:hypothetical protein